MNEINLPYLGPKLTDAVKRRPFWTKNKQLPLGGCFKVTFDHEIDGDTAGFWVDGEIKTVRFFVIDTPEVSPKPDPYGLTAKQYTSEKLKNASEIYLQSDKLDSLFDNTERKRLLAWIWVDGELLNYQLVRLGLATVKYVNNEKMVYVKVLREAEKQAKKECLGLHSKHVAA